MKIAFPGVIQQVNKVPEFRDSASETHFLQLLVFLTFAQESRFYDDTLHGLNH
jgi:hypothetical protein